MTDRPSKTAWERKSRSEKLAACLWPNLETAEVRKEMEALSANEGRRAPFTPPLPNGKAS